MTYTITLAQMAFHTHIGVYPEEKQIGQDLTIDLTLTIVAEPTNDDLTTTVNYGAIYDEIKTLVNQSRVDLIETLSQELLDLVLDIDQRILEATITINKMGLPIDGILDHVAVTLNRKRGGDGHA
ncbi:MAG: dihydroneopterin aldolase [Aerococcus sp.]|nr:dihydroneopterin aldolase [Aerococcus sp.]